MISLLSRLVVCALVLAVLPGVACSPSVAEGEGEGEGEGREGEGEGEGPPLLPSCSDSSNCRGGELCVDEPDGSVCREVCDEDADCDSSFYDTCDLTLSHCVQCVSDDNCRSNEACVDALCTFFCGDDGDCDSDEVCDAALGSCRTAECRDDDECDGGFVCTDARCVSILPVICDANTTRCATESSFATCNAAGTRDTITACDAEEACVVNDDGTAGCATVVCVANDFGCENDDTAFVCDNSGTQRALLACRADQYCTDGTCRTRVCAPDTITCSGDSRIVCDETGATSTVSPCGDEVDCAASDFGCSCRPIEGRGACVERICSPGIGQCVGNGVRVCNGSGSGFSAVVACGANDCIEGRCLPNACTANSTVCSGDTLLTCESDGTGYRATTCSETCAGDDGSARCVNQICEPRTSRCDAAGEAVLTCNDRGAAEVSTECVDGFCENGICKNEVCAPNSKRCASTTTALVCDARGGTETSVTCGVDEACEAGVCVDTSCIPSCGQRECGIESRCGASCGACGANESCNTTGQCVANTPTSGRVMTVKLSWNGNAGADFDSYLSRSPDEPMCSLDTCYVGTCVAGDPLRPDWDQNGAPSAGDPVAVFSTDSDETVTVTLPTTARTYRMGAWYDSTSSATAATTVRISVLLDNVEIDAASKSVAKGALWDGTTLVWNGTRITMVDSTRTTADFACDESPGSCQDDAECPAGQFCDGDNFLLPGTCAVGCRSTADCGAGNSCVGGTCTTSTVGGVGDSCSDNAGCTSPLVCGRLTGTCTETCEQSTCVFAGFFGCCELTAEANGTADCNQFGFCR